MAGDSIARQIAANEVAKHAAERNAHGVAGAIMGQNHAHTGGTDGTPIEATSIANQMTFSSLLAFAAAHG